MNEYHDITRFPKTWGMIVFPISMSRISNAQSATECMNVLRQLMPKIQEPKVGANFIYSEGLYITLEENVNDLKYRYAQNSISHMQAVKRIRQKERIAFQIGEAFQFSSWFQMYLSHTDFFSIMGQVRTFYNNDPLFQKYVLLDAESAGRELTEAQLSFYLEEHVFTYLLLYQQLNLSNDYLQGREEWVLEVYPGPALRGAIYLCQQDPFSFGPSTNPFIGQYDSTQSEFVNYLKTDLETYAT